MKRLFRSILTLGLSIIGHGHSQKYQFDHMYLELRKKAFSVSPKDLKLTENKIGKVYGVLMETGFPESICTLTAFAEGSVSLYFSNGGGMIGIGEHEAPRKIALDYINNSKEYLKFSSKTKVFPNPIIHETIFYFLTFDGVYTFRDSEENFGNYKNDLSKLFHKAQELITEARAIKKG